MLHDNFKFRASRESHECDVDHLILQPPLPNTAQSQQLHDNTYTTSPTSIGKKSIHINPLILTPSSTCLLSGGAGKTTSFYDHFILLILARSPSRDVKPQQSRVVRATKELLWGDNYRYFAHWLQNIYTICLSTVHKSTSTSIMSMAVNFPQSGSLDCIDITI